MLEVHMFWHGRDFTRVEQLSTLSWLKLGYQVRLHTYEPLRGVPNGVEVEDAARIIPKGEIFMHRHRRSLAPFANWFRYELLASTQVLWSDTDIVALDHPAETEYVFGWQDRTQINNALLSYPPGSELAARLLDVGRRPHLPRRGDAPGHALRKLSRVARGAQKGDIYWGETGPDALTTAVRRLGLVSHAAPPKVFYPVHYTEWARLLLPLQDDPLDLLDGATTVHLWQEKLRRAGIDTTAPFAPNSLFEALWRLVTA